MKFKNLYLVEIHRIASNAANRRKYTVLIRYRAENEHPRLRHLAPTEISGGKPVIVVTSHRGAAIIAGRGLGIFLFSITMRICDIRTLAEWALDEARDCVRMCESVAPVA